MSASSFSFYLPLALGAVLAIVAFMVATGPAVPLVLAGFVISATLPGMLYAYTR